jgi:hypothetical protein
MSRWASIAIAAWLAVSGGGCQPPPRSKQMLDPEVAPIVFAADAAALERGELAESFPLASLRDLWVRVTVPELARVALLELSFAGPQGQVLHVDYAHFSADPAIREVDVAEVGHPLPVFTAKPLASGFALDHPVAIGGTVFQRHPTEGDDWQVRATLDGVDAQSASLRLTTAL